MKRILTLALFLILAAVQPVSAQHMWAFNQSGYGGAAGVSYAAWDEASESTLAVDQDGDGIEDTFIMFMENTSAGGNETGRGGGLTGINLVGTQSGNLAGSTTIPPSRIFDGANDYMSFNPTTLDVVSNGTNIWTILAKCENISEAQTNDHATPFYFFDGADDILGIFHSSGTNVQAWVGGVHHLDTTLADPIPTTGTVYIAAWSDGTYVRAGWTTGGAGANGQPTGWTEFPGGSKASATASVSWPLGTFTSALYQFMRFNAAYTQGTIKYFLMSKTCLIDNAS